MLLGNSQKEETNKAIIRRLYSLLFFTLFSVLIMRGRYIIMKNLKKTIKNIKGDKNHLIFYVGLVLAILVAGRVIINSIIK